MGLQKQLNRNKVVAYIEAVLFHKKTKRDAYLTFIDDSVKNPSAAVLTMEKKPEFMAIYQAVMDDDEYKFQKNAIRVKGKYLNLVEKNIDTMDKVLDDVKDKEVQDRAIAVRLANETLQAMAIVSGPSQPSSPGKLNRGGAIV